MDRERNGDLKDIEVSAFGCTVREKGARVDEKKSFYFGAGDEPKKVPLSAVSQNLTPQTPETIFELLYGRARPGGYIAMGALRPGKRGIAPRYWTVLPSLKYQPLLPGILSAQPEYTKYIAPNTLDRKALCGRNPERFVKRVLRGEKPLYFGLKDKHVRELCAIWVDLDSYKSGLDNAMAFALVMYKIARGDLPWPSMVAYSGKGSYYLWLLREHDGWSVPLCNSENKHIWQTVITETIHRTSELESDSRAKNVARMLKAPGTFHPKTGEQVWYMTVGADTPLNVPLYSLPELMQFYGIKNIAPAPPVKSLPAPHKPQERKRRVKDGRESRSRAPSRRRFNELQALAHSRHGFVEGYRHHACLFYYSELRNYYSRPPDSMDVKESFELAREKAREFNEQYCKPPLSANELYKCTPHRRPKRPTRYSTITAALRVTRQEALELDLVALRPPPLREEARRHKEKEKSLREHTRALIRAGIAAGKSDTAIRHELGARHGIEASKQRVNYWRHREQKGPGPRQEELKA